MDKLIFNIPEIMVSKEDIVVKVDGEAAAMLIDLSNRTGMNKKYIVSEMIKFAYPRTEVKQVALNFGERK